MCICHFSSETVCLSWSADSVSRKTNVWDTVGMIELMGDSALRWWLPAFRVRLSPSALFMRGPPSPERKSTPQPLKTNTHTHTHTYLKHPPPPFSPYPQEQTCPLLTFNPYNLNEHSLPCFLFDDWMWKQKKRKEKKWISGSLQPIFSSININRPHRWNNQRWRGSGDSNDRPLMAQQTGKCTVTSISRAFSENILQPLSKRGGKKNDSRRPVFLWLFFTFPSSAQQRAIKLSPPMMMTMNNLADISDCWPSVACVCSLLLAASSSRFLNT